MSNMNQQTIFYYPYASFKNEQLPFLKTAALYFEKIFILDPEKSGYGQQGFGFGDEGMEKEIAVLESTSILQRIKPEEVLAAFQSEITNSIQSDLSDPVFRDLCDNNPDNKSKWLLSLAKVPKELSSESNFEKKEIAMRQLLTQTLNQDAYYEDHLRGNQMPCRYAVHDLKIGEAIMVNHALYGALLKGAVPVTDDPFHAQAFNAKIKRASEN